MTIKFLRNNNKAEFFLEGRMDSTNSNEVEKALLDTVSNNDFSDIIIDMEELEYISSAGLRVFLKLYMNFHKTGKKIFIRNASSGIMNVFEMTGFVSLFKFI